MSRSGLLRHFVPAALVACGAISISAAGCVEAEGRFYVDSTCFKEGDGTLDCEQYVSSINVAYVRCDDLDEVSLSPCPSEAGNQLRACETLEVDGELASVCQEGLYVGVLLVNAMTPSTDNLANFNDVETSTIFVSGYDVRLDNGVSERTFVYNASASVAPGRGETAIFVQVVPLGDDGQAVLEEAEAAGVTSGFAGVRFYGRTSGGIDVETPEFFLAVTFAQQSL
jgi:hypothetical protein